MINVTSIQRRVKSLQNCEVFCQQFRTRNIDFAKHALSSFRNSSRWKVTSL